MSLQLMVAEAVNLQDHSRIAQLHETRRCIQDLDNKCCRQLLQVSVPLWTVRGTGGER